MPRGETHIPGRPACTTCCHSQPVQIEENHSAPGIWGWVPPFGPFEFKSLSLCRGDKYDHYFADANPLRYLHQEEAASFRIRISQWELLVLSTNCSLALEKSPRDCCRLLGGKGSSSWDHSAGLSHDFRSLCYTFLGVGGPGTIHGGTSYWDTGQVRS